MKRRSRFEEMLLERGILHEKAVLAKRKHVEVKGRTLELRFKRTIELMEEGADLIYHGVLLSDEYAGEPDLLEKRTDHSSKFGAYHYVAIEIKSAERIADPHKYQLVLYGELLKEVQDHRPTEGYVLNGSGILLSFSLREFEMEFHRAVREIQESLEGKQPIPHLSSGCKNSPWFGECVALAEKSQDIALLYNVKKRTIQALRELGISSIRDAVTMDVEAIAGTSSRLTKKTLERAVLQAKALIEKRHIVRKPVSLPESELEIFFDIEGDPLREVEYLFGFMTRAGDKEEYLYFLAKKPDQEVKMWKEFRKWVKGLPDHYVVYHFGTYEKSRLTMLEGRYGGADDLVKFRERMVDLNEVVKDHVILPLYFYGIKYIGEYIGFHRGQEIAGGAESVGFYEDWLKTRDKETMEAILRYNEDDVIATRFLKDWLVLEAS